MLGAPIESPQECIGTVDFPPSLDAPQPFETRVAPGVVADGVPLGNDATHQLGIPFRMFPYDEESRTRIVRCKEVQQRWGVFRIRAVVKSQVK